MLTRSTQVGEFYVMQPPQLDPGWEKHRNLFTSDLLIYDEESDRHIRITWQDAMGACCIKGTKDADGNPIVSGEPNGSIDATGKVFLAYGPHEQGKPLANTTKQWLEDADKINKYNTGHSSCDENSYSKLERDTRIVVARPFIEHLMHSVILTVAGRDTGATLFGPADMQLSANTQVKTIEGYACIFELTHKHTYHLQTRGTGSLPQPQSCYFCSYATFFLSVSLLTTWHCFLHRHYTGHFKAVITKPQNVLIMRDVAAAGYVAGMNTQWFARSYDGTNEKMYSLATATNSMMSRLSFSDDMGSKYSSMLAFPCWANQFESGQLDTVMSITTRLLPWEVSSSGGGTHDSFPGGEGAWKAYSTALNLRSVHFGEDMKAAENQEFISQVSSTIGTLLSSFEPNERCETTLIERGPCMCSVDRDRQTTRPASSAPRVGTTRSRSRS